MKVGTHGIAIVATTALSLAAIVMSALALSRGEPEKTARVAVIDLTAIASNLGRDREWSESERKLQASLIGEYNQVRTSLEEAYNAKKKEYGDKPTESQKMELGELLGKLNAELEKVQRGLQARLAKDRASAQKQFRSDVALAAKAVREEAGIDLVVTNNDQFLVEYESKVEITDQVTDRMRVASREP